MNHSSIDDNIPSLPFDKIKLTKPEPFTNEYKRNIKDLFSKTQKLLSFNNVPSLSYQLIFNHSSLQNIPSKPLSTRNINKRSDDTIIQSYKHIHPKYKSNSLSPLPHKQILNKHKHFIINKNESPSNVRIVNKNIGIFSPRIVKRKKGKMKGDEQYGKISNVLEHMMYDSSCFMKMVEKDNMKNSIGGDGFKYRMRGVDNEDFNVLISIGKGKERKEDGVKFLKNKKNVFMRCGLVNLIDFGDCYSKLDPAYCLQNKQDIFKRYNKLRRALHIIKKEDDSHNEKSFSYILKPKISAIDLFYKTKEKIDSLLNNNNNN